MSEIKIGNSPVSWGTLELEQVKGGRIGYQQYLDELVGTGYFGTELGDVGFMPTDPAVLRSELERRKVSLLGVYLPIAFRNADAHAEGEARAVDVARLLAKVASGNERPFIAIGDANGSDPVRTLHAGRVTPELGLSDADWRTFAAGVERVARAVKEVTGLPTVFHPHCAGFVETPEETARLLELTDPNLVGLCLDTGHWQYGTGSNDRRAIPEALGRFGDRLWYIHLKDCHAEIADRARVEGWDYFKALHSGVFCELGQGCVDFPGLVKWLQRQGYDGWMVVQQDVLPGMGSPKASAERNRAYLRSIGV